MKVEGKRVLITGGSSGIGLALAQAMLAKGAKVVVTGRRPELLAKAIEELRGTSSSTGVSLRTLRPPKVALKPSRGPSKYSGGSTYS